MVLGTNSVFLLNPRAVLGNYRTSTWCLLGFSWYLTWASIEGNHNTEEDSPLPCSILVRKLMDALLSPGHFICYQTHTWSYRGSKARLHTSPQKTTIGEVSKCASGATWLLDGGRVENEICRSTEKSKEFFRLLILTIFLTFGIQLLTMWICFSLQER